MFIRDVSFLLIYEVGAGPFPNDGAEVRSTFVIDGGAVRRIKTSQIQKQIRTCKSFQPCCHWRSASCSSRYGWRRSR